MILKKIIMRVACLVALSMVGNALFAVDSVAITTPAVSSTVSGQPLIITGTSSQASSSVRLTIDSTEIGTATTDGLGDWMFTLLNLNNGSYAIRADLLSNTSVVLATSTNGFMVHNPETITIDSPIDGDVIFLSSLMATGQSSLASSNVQLLIDASLVTTTTTDVNGSWQAMCTLSSNGAHTLLAKLLVAGVPVATDSVAITAAIPVIFPTGRSQITIIDGEAPTSGSGSGVGYTYSVSGSIITINFSPAFATVPAVIATGFRSSGSSTVTLASVSTSAANISFSAGTQKVHFTAMTFA